MPLNAKINVSFSRIMMIKTASLSLAKSLTMLYTRASHIVCNLLHFLSNDHHKIRICEVNLRHNAHYFNVRDYTTIGSTVQTTKADVVTMFVYFQVHRIGLTG